MNLTPETWTTSAFLLALAASMTAMIDASEEADELLAPESVEEAVVSEVFKSIPVSYTHLTLPTKA